MKTDQFFTMEELLEKFPSLRVYYIDYYVRNRVIPCIKSGRGNPRKFPPETIEIILVRLKILQVKK